MDSTALLETCDLLSPPLEVLLFLLSLSSQAASLPPVPAPVILVWVIQPSRGRGLAVPVGLAALLEWGPSAFLSTSSGGPLECVPRAGRHHF